MASYYITLKDWSVVTPTGRKRVREDGTPEAEVIHIYSQMPTPRFGPRKSWITREDIWH